MPRRTRRAAPRDTMIVLAKDQGSLYEFLKERQEATGRGRIVLERRVEERRRARVPVGAERRHADRRALVPDAARALMSVLGFAILHPESDGAASARAHAPARRSGRTPVRRRSTPSSPPPDRAPRVRRPRRRGPKRRR